MKIHRLSLTGFGPFKGTEVVDFDRLGVDGIFLITGRTGAGKTSILDGITFALYGKTARYNADKPNERVRSDYLDLGGHCEVVLELSTAEHRYRVTRSPEYLRPKKRGEGLTRHAASILIEQADASGEWEVVETKTGGAEKYVSDLVGLSPTEFLQVILLAQGKFQEFLVADSKQRSVLLARLFDTDRFERITEALTARARELNASDAEVGARIAANVRTLESAGVDPTPRDSDHDVLAWAEACLGEVTVAAASAAAAARAAEAEYQGAFEAHAEATNVEDRQTRLAQAQADLAAVRLEQPAQDARRALMDRRYRANKVHRLLERVNVARDGLAQARDLHAQQTARLDSDQSEMTLDLAVAEASRLAQLVGELRAVIVDEETLTRINADVERVESKAEEARAAITATDQLLAELAESLAAVRDVQDSNRQLAEEYPRCQREADDLAARYEAAARRDEAGEVLAAAVGVHAEAQAELALVQQRQRELAAAQLRGYAGHLASILVEGSPCVVCGSTTHPAKASSANVITDEQILAAEAAIVEAARDEAVARDALVEAQTRLAGFQAQAGDASTSDIGAAVAVAQAKVAASEAALNARGEASEQEALLRDQREEATALRSKHETAVAALDAELAGVKRQAHVLERGVASHRAGYPTIQARLDAILARAEALAGYIETARRVESAVSAGEAAEGELRDKMRELGFASVEEVEALVVDEAAYQAGWNEVDAFEVRKEAAEKAVLAPDLQDVPTEPTDTASTSIRLADADHRRKEAAEAEGSTRQRCRMVEAVVSEIRQASQERGELAEQRDLVDSLARTLRGDNDRKLSLHNFVLAADLEEILIAANNYLQTMTQRRYSFAHDDDRSRRGGQAGLDIELEDAYTGEARAPESLSGGEKFQASLALALGLSEVVTSRAGGLRLDTLFIDEGFGTLDSETLETVMATLDSLQQSGRTIGLISHVEAMKESITTKLHVEVTPGGWSHLGAQ